MSNSALAIYFDAPMQSWGASSRYEHRETEAFPTKSGVLGMLAAAMGIDKDSEEEANAIAELSSITFSALRINGNGNRLVQRLTDYHTVGGGYDKKDPNQKLHIPRKASGGFISNAVITRRTYLTDAKFVAILQGETELLLRCSTALKDPKWGIWFGRKACLPAAPLTPCIADTKAAAIEKLGKIIDFDTEALGPGQTEESGDGAYHQNDQPISFANQVYRSRPVKRS